MKKKTKILMIVLISFAIFITAFVIFINIPFEVEFTLVGEYPMGDDVNDPFLLFTDIGYRSISKKEIDYDIEFVSNQEFTNYAKSFNYTDEFLIFSSRKPIKKIIFQYKMYSEALVNFMYRHSMSKLNEYLFFDVELDEDAESAEYYYLYKVSDTRVRKKWITRFF